MTLSLFTRLIIRLFQFFSVGTVFFSHDKSANIVFQPAYQPNQTGPLFTFLFEGLMFSMCSSCCKFLDQVGLDRLSGAERRREQERERDGE
jgi:hypothetical protein